MKKKDNHLKYNCLKIKNKNNCLILILILNKIFMNTLSPWKSVTSICFYMFGSESEGNMV